MFATVDVTPISSPSAPSAYVSEVAAGPTPFQEHLRDVFAAHGETPFLETTRVRTEQTSAHALELSLAEVRDDEDDTAEVDPVIVKIRDDRVALLARNYAGEGSVEDAARFHILTERLRRVDQELLNSAHNVLANKVAALEATVDTIANIRAKYNLR